MALRSDHILLVGAGGVALWAMLRATGALGSVSSSFDPSRASQEVDIVARTIWAEARGDGARGMQAVANVIMNRANHPGWWGTDPISVCMKPYQFSAWNSNDVNSGKAARVTVEDAAFRVALELAGKAVAGTLPDITGSATHYHNHTVSPGWAASLRKTAEIGGHVFYA
ncbi:MAG: cell wall hydrolase [Kiloniellaceae bacterium]